MAWAHNAISTDVAYTGGDDDFGSPEPLAVPCTEDGYSRVESRTLLAPALAHLSAREREVLVMRYVGQHTQAEIARAIGLSQMQVSRLIRRSLDKIRERLRDQDYDYV